MSGKRPLRVLGLHADALAGGVTAAEVVTGGQGISDLGRWHFEPFSQAETRVFDSRDADEVGAVVEDAAARAMEHFDPPELIGFRGVLLREDAEHGVVEEAGSGAMLAAAAGCRVAWKFLENDVQMGGVGLTLPGLFAHPLLTVGGLEGRQALLTLGARSRLTVAELDEARSERAVSVTEAGPGMALLEGYSGGSHGEVADQVVAKMLSRPFFARLGPRVVSARLLSECRTTLDALPDAQRRASAEALIALSAAAALELHEEPVKALWLTGAGTKETMLVDLIRAASPVPVRLLSELSLAERPLKPLATEAQATAWMAARVVAGLPTSGPGITGARGFVGGAEVSRPQE